MNGGIAALEMAFEGIDVHGDATHTTETDIRAAVKDYCDAVPIRATIHRICIEKQCHEMSDPGDCGPDAVLAGLLWGRETRKAWRAVSTRIKSNASHDGLRSDKPRPAPAPPIHFEEGVG